MVFVSLLIAPLVMAMICAVPALIVGVAVLTTRHAGPVAAGAVAAFPTMSTTLAVAVARRDG